mgnify:CR=1 FL=1
MRVFRLTTHAVDRYVARVGNGRPRDVAAREAQADHYAEEILQIADDGTGDSWTDDDGNVRTNTDVVARSKLRVDARKWKASKLAPKKYGDRVEQAVSLTHYVSELPPVAANPNEWLSKNKPNPEDW